MADPTIGQYIPLSKLQGYPLPPDLPLFATGPAMDFTGRPSDTMQREYSQYLARAEQSAADQPEHSQNVMDREMQAMREQDILEQLQQALAYQQVDRQRAMASEPGVDLSQMAGGMPAMPQPRYTAPAMPTQRAGATWDSLSFPAAFRLAKAQGLPQFNWRGKPYAVAVAPKRRYTREIVDGEPVLDTWPAAEQAQAWALAKGRR